MCITCKNLNVEGTIKEKPWIKDKFHDSHSHFLKKLLTSLTVYLTTPIPFLLENFITASSIPSTARIRRLENSAAWLIFCFWWQLLTGYLLLHRLLHKLNHCEMCNTHPAFEVDRKKKEKKKNPNGATVCTSVTVRTGSGEQVTKLIITLMAKVFMIPALHPDLHYSKHTLCWCTVQYKYKPANG